jgi:hypothetical protein
VWSVLKATVGLRLTEEDEQAGIDQVELGMEAYPEFPASRTEAAAPVLDPVCPEGLCLPALLHVLETACPKMLTCFAIGACKAGAEMLSCLVANRGGAALADRRAGARGHDGDAAIPG